MISADRIVKYIPLVLLSLIETSWADTETVLDSSWRDSVQFHGFAAQSYIHTEGNNFFGESEDGSFDFHELGINTLWRPTSNLQLALQLVARDAGKTDDGDLRVDYAFLDYALMSSDTGATGLRVGRVVNPYGFYNDTRDIAATRPSILLPQSIYFDVNRNFALSSDGVQLYHEYGDDSGDYTFQLGVFEPRMEDPDFEPAIFFQTVPGELEGTTSWMGRVIYERDFGRIRLGFTAAEVVAEYDPGSIDPIPSGEFQFRPYMLSAQYNRENWSLTAEYSKRTTELAKFESFRNIEFTGTSYFVQGTYRIHQNWELFVRYDELIWNDDDEDGEEFEAITAFFGQRIPAHSRFAKDWTMGLRWDINQKVMVRTEWHNINGTGWLSKLENPNPTGTEQYWDLFSVTAAIRF